MKTTWVLTDEERKQKFEGRGKRKSCSGDSQPEENKEEASTAGKKVFAHSLTIFWSKFELFLYRQHCLAKRSFPQLRGT